MTPSQVQTARASASSAPAIHTRDTLELTDPVIAGLVSGERHRQEHKLVFIASESLCPEPVRQALSTEFGNLYAEGYPSTRMVRWEREHLDDEARHHAFYQRYGDRRYYKGCEYANLLEAETIHRLTQLMATDKVPAERLYANVQSLSGAAANNAVYEALVPQGATVLGMNLSCGGHLTHGSPVNRSGKHYHIVAYGVDRKDGKLDYEALKALAKKEKPAMVIAGYSAYPWQIDWAKFREVADSCGAKLLADIAHPAGLVVAGEFASPIGYADVVSFTTHKTLCGPRGAVIVTQDPQIARRIDFAVFPGEQGGPHLHAIAGKAVSFRLAATEDFRRLQKQVRANAAALAAAFAEGGLALAYGGTDTHLCLVDLSVLVSPTGEPVAADIAARVLDNLGITCNKNSLAGDTRAAHPSGLRFGTTWVSQRGLDEADLREVASTICDTLTSMHAFSVQTGFGKVGRVRLPSSVLRDARRRVHGLLERKRAGARSSVFHFPHFEPTGAPGNARPVVEGLPAPSEKRRVGASEVAARYASADAERSALETGAALVDTSAAPVVLVAGERAGCALQLSLSGQVLGLKTGAMAQTRALDPDGRNLGDLRVLRLADGPLDIERYLVLGDTSEDLVLVDWLRELSDGFVAFDPDITRKVDGPVVVLDLGLGEGEDPRVVWTLAGPKARAALQAAKLPVPEVGAARTQGDRVVLGHALGGAEVFECVVPLAEASAVLASLAEHTTTVGALAYEEWRRAKGAPARGSVPPALPGDAHKPYFVGQRAVVADFGKEVAEFTAPAATSDALLHTPLFDWHKAHTKKWNLVPFAGWEMPVMYTGIVEEHRAVRETAGLFDVAHMGVFEVRGPGALRFLDLVTTNYVAKLRDGEGQYTYTLGIDGDVLDDLLIYRRGRERFLVVVNASNADKVLAWWRSVADRSLTLDRSRPSVRADVDVQIVDLKDPAAGDEQRVDLAFQGPASLPTLLELCAQDADREAILTLKKFALTEVTMRGRSVLVARTGYTGEEVGYELYVHPGHAVEVWEAILEAGASRGVVPAGLGARDSTRTEAGFPLYGHELAGPHGIGPQGAGYSAFVKWHKPFFVGRDPLLARERARKERILRARVTDPAARPVREGDAVVDAKGRYLGPVTSSAYAGGDQIVLFHGTEDAVEKGAALGIFPMPRGKGKLPPERPKDELERGDKVLLPIPAIVVTRFLTRSEKRSRKYVR